MYMEFMTITLQTILVNSYAPVVGILGGARDGVGLERDCGDPSLGFYRGKTEALDLQITPCKHMCICVHARMGSKFLVVEPGKILLLS